MCSIISFGNVRMIGMGSKLITSYAAFGVGLAIVLTFGLGAISSVTEQHLENQLAAQPESPTTGVQPMPEAEEKAMKTSPPPALAPAIEAPVPSPPSKSSEAEEKQQNVNATAATPAGTSATTSKEKQQEVNATATSPAGTFGATSEKAVVEKAPASKEEIGRESNLVISEVPSPLSPFLVILPYIAAAVAGSVVFVVTRKRVGW